MFQRLKSNQRNEFPRYMFSKGITNLTLLTASEWVGVAFLLAMITISSQGKNFWKSVNERLETTGETVITGRGICRKYIVTDTSLITTSEDEKPPSILCNSRDILYVLEMNLSFYAWYKCGEPLPITDMTSIAVVKKSITILLTLIKQFTPRNHGNGWKIQKFHKLLHLPVDIYMFGSPQNYDNSPTEHGLIETAKQPSDHAQKSNALFVSQVMKRVLETVLIKKAKQALLRSRTEESEESHSYEFSKLSNSASFHIMFDDDGKCLPKWLGKLHLKNDVQLESVLLHWIYLSKKNKTSIFYEVSELFVHLEYTRNGKIFRCHPKYRSNGKWYDWVMVQFEDSKNNCKGMWSPNYYPCKIMCFLQYQTNSQFMLWFIPPKQVIMTMIVYYLRDGKWNTQ